jgi:hypothetical protein
MRPRANPTIRKRHVTLQLIEKEERAAGASEARPECRRDDGAASARDLCTFQGAATAPTARATARRRKPRATGGKLYEQTSQGGLFAFNRTLPFYTKINSRFCLKPIDTFRETESYAVRFFAWFFCLRLEAVLMEISDEWETGKACLTFNR